MKVSILHELPRLFEIVKCVYHGRHLYENGHHLLYNQVFIIEHSMHKCYFRATRIWFSRPVGKSKSDWQRQNVAAASPSNELLPSLSAVLKQWYGSNTSWWDGRNGWCMDGWSLEKMDENVDEWIDGIIQTHTRIHTYSNGCGSSYSLIFDNCPTDQHSIDFFSH